MAALSPNASNCNSVNALYIAPSCFIKKEPGYVCITHKSVNHVNVGSATIWNVKEPLKLQAPWQ